jgi:RNA-directed DNA polymerase
MLWRGYGFGRERKYVLWAFYSTSLYSLAEYILSMYGFTKKDRSTLFLYQDCEKLRQDFLGLREPEDVAELLEVSYSRLKYHIRWEAEDKRYIDFSIPKKSGKPRIISAPCTPLKILQRKLSQVLYCVYEPKAAVQGFIPDRSILTNAKKHVHKRFILNIDLKDFFHSIHFGRVKGIFMKPPYTLPEKVAEILAKLCCYSGRLPQGAPTSPIVSNIICARMDSELRKLSTESKCTYYTRYADDLTFSTTLSKFPYELAYIETSEDVSKLFVGEKLRFIIESNGFEINQDKVRLQHKSQHQEVTGLTVNQFPNVKRSFVREISSMLYAWDKFGLASVELRYREKCEKDFEKSGYIPKFKEIPSYKEVLRGKINFLGMVRGKDNTIYLRYSGWFHALSKRDFAQSTIDLPTSTSSPTAKEPT